MRAGSVTGSHHRRQAVRWVIATAAASASMLAAGCGGSADSAAGEGDVVVMAASSLTEVVEIVFGGRESVTPVIAGSSTLVAQLAAGAGADVLITANATTMQRAVSEGSVRGEPVLIATNTLVLATPAGNPGGVTGLTDLARSDLLIGLCAVEVPCGTLARTALKEARIVPSVDTLEPNARALTTKLSLGELDAGLVYSTDAAMAGLPTVDAPELHLHLNRYYIASVSAEPPPSVQAVIDAFTDGASGTRALLHAYGFGPPEWYDIARRGRGATKALNTYGFGTP